MKRLNKTLLSLLLAIVLLFSYTLPVFSVEAKAAPTTYSKQYNSGERDEICLSLSGTSASTYYTGNYTYDYLEDQSASAIKSALHNLMANTHTTLTSYDDCHYKADRTDCENENGKVVLLYTSYTATMSQWNGWNREHVWPKSIGGTPLGLAEKKGGSDLHHLRPSDAVVNSTRGNMPYGNVSGGKTVTGSKPANGYVGGTYGGGYFEPLDNVKGDVARICLYMYVRWGSEWGADPITKVFQSVDVLLEWCELDPVDTWEMGRNEVVQAIQGNRNVFIDYPEYAWLIFGEEVPDDMQTPSGKAMGKGDDTPVTPTHSCESICIVCGFCLNTNCTESACKTKCKGHTPVTPFHTCESPCTTCGKCTDATCTESACANKCQGHVVHSCESPCTTCGKCTDTTCRESACANKCQGHVVHVCENVCPTCGLCTNQTCTYPECIHKCPTHAHVCVSKCAICDKCTNLSCTSYYCLNKCKGHTPVTPTHSCESPCSTCGKCTDTTCRESACANKCQGHVVHVCENVCPTCGKCTDATCTEAACLSKCQGHTPVTPPHTCESPCTACGKCTDAACAESACASKCQGHCTHANTVVKNSTNPTCAGVGYSGDTYCADCDVKLSGGSEIPATGEHDFTTWTLNEEGTERSRSCKLCGKTETVEVQQDEPTDPPVVEPPVTEEPETPEELIGSLESDAEKILILIILGNSQGLIIGELTE